MKPSVQIYIFFLSCYLFQFAYCQITCAENEALSSDRSQCITCQCDGCGVKSNYTCYSIKGIVYDTTVTGMYLDQYLVYSITGQEVEINDTIPTCIGGQIITTDSSHYICDCGSGYELSNGYCYESSAFNALPTISQITYNYLEEDNKYKTTTFSSDFYEINTRQAIIGCQGGNVEKCQLLANLCVLRMYEPSSAECSAFLSIQDTFDSYRDNNL